MTIQNAREKRKLRIALVSDWYYPRTGGVEYSINSLARYLQEEGHAVDIITHGDSSSNIDGHVNCRRIGGKVIHNGFLNIIYSILQYFKLKKIIQQGNYDIINAHGLTSPLGIMSLFIGRALNIKSVLTDHSSYTNDPVRIFIYLISPLYRPAHCMIAVSPLVQKESRQFFSKKIFLVPNGFDLHSPNVSKEIEVRRSTNITITMIARFVHKKNHEEFVHVARTLAKSGKNYSFVLIGDGPRRRKIENMVNRYNLSKLFTFTGEISRSEVLRILEITDIMLLTSRQEAFGIVILEAFYKKVPVIVRDKTGASDLIAHGETGFLAKDCEEYCHHIETILRDKEQTAKIVESAFSKIKEYDWCSIAEKTADIYMHISDEDGFEKNLSDN